MRPYKNLVLSDKEIIRKFQETVDEHDLLWHRDAETRLIKSVHDTDWLIQLDNCLPVSLNQEVYIERECWHRLIKGTGELVLLIKIIN